MSISNNGILFYGYCLPEGAAISNELYQDAYDSDDSDVGIGTHCSDSCPLFYIYWKESEIMAHRGSPKRVGVWHISKVFDGNAYDAIIAFAKKNELQLPDTGEEYEKSSKIGWWLVSYWG